MPEPREVSSGDDGEGAAPVLEQLDVSCVRGVGEQVLQGPLHLFSAAGADDDDEEEEYESVSDDSDV